MTPIAAAFLCLLAFWVMMARDDVSLPPPPIAKSTLRVLPYVNAPQIATNP